MRLRETRLLLTLFFLPGILLTAQNPTVSISIPAFPHREPLNVLPGQTAVRLCGLQPGNTYQVIASRAFPEQQPVFRLRMAAPEQESIAREKSPADRPQVRRFKATDNCADLLLDVTANGTGGEVPAYLSVGCVDCKETGSWQNHFVQNVADMAPPKLTVTAGNAAKDLVTNVLIGGNCFDVSNITSKGASTSRGTFSNGLSSIDISNGVVLCTAPTTVLPGPNNQNNVNGGYSSIIANDANLKTLTAGDQYDLSVIEFDFKPTANMVQFDFVFGSDEYCEYVNSIYNDVFGFFISGPGITGVQNLAILPSDKSPVTVNNVNHLKNSQFYRNNNTYQTCFGQPVTNMADIQLDGFTTVLTATANLQPCKTYHIKLAIADIEDENYTSAVFLRANSFDAGGQVKAEAVYPSAAQAYTVEGCGNGYIRFYRGTGDANQPLPITYKLAPGSTAASGVDYDPLPALITIPAGDTQVLVPINVIKDLLPEGAESFTLLLDNACSCQQQDVTFVIHDPTPLSGAMADQTVCAGNATLTPVINGGLAPLNYQWNNGQSTPSINVSSQGANIFTVTVSDVCGSSAVLSATATVDQTPTAILSGLAQFCPGGSGQFNIAFTGLGPWVVAYNAGGIPQSQTFYSNPGQLTVTQPGTYALNSVTSQAGCPGLAGGSGVAEEVTVNIGLTVASPPCFGDRGAIQAVVNSNFPPYTYSWNNGATSPGLNNLPPGNYSLTVSTPQGCTSVASAFIVEPPELTTALSNIVNINCYQPQGSANLNVQGGTPGYQYSWSNGVNQANGIFQAGGTYTVTVTDTHQCKSVSKITILQDTAPPDAFASVDKEITCNTPEVDLSSAGSSAGPSFSYAWSTQIGNILTDPEESSATVDAAGIYSLLVTNVANGCTKTAQVLVKENTNYPVALDLQIVQPGCGGKPGELLVAGVTGGEEPFVFSVDGGNAFMNQFSFNNMAPGQYTIVVQDINGCEFEQKVELVAPVEPEVSIVPEVDLHYGETALLKAILNVPAGLLDTIIWSPPYGLEPTGRPDEVFARPFKTTKYTVTVISKEGCTDRAELIVRVGDPDIYAPNAIRPSSVRGKNDMFMLFARDNTINEVKHLQIFDRWGNQVFARDHFQTNDDRSTGWDGSFRGKILGPGVFTWWADVELASGEQIRLTGDVTIVE